MDGRDHKHQGPDAHPCELETGQAMRYARDLARLYALEKAREQDIRSGASVQQKFLTPASEVTARLREVGFDAFIRNTAPSPITGDFFVLKPIDGENVGFLLADACGHGLSAALLSMRIVSFIQTAERYVTEPAMFLLSLNQDLVGLELRDKFVAASYGMLGPHGCLLANAGLPFPILAGPGGVREAPAKGAPLGIVRYSPLEATKHIELAQGERMAFYTDGLVEAWNEATGEAYGLERLTACFERGGGDSVEDLGERIHEDLAAFLGETPAQDDISLAIFQKRAVQHAVAGDPHVSIVSGAEPARQKLFDEIDARLAGVFEEEVEHELFLLAVVEAVNNAFEHGNAGVQDAAITVRHWFGNGVAMVSVQDQGPGHAPVFRDLSALEGRRGRGLALMRANVDTVLFNENANQTILIKGGDTMNMEVKHGKATVTTMPNGVVLVSQLELGDSRYAVANGLAEVLEGVGGDASSIFVDLRNVRAISSMGWGTVFATAEKDQVQDLVLFNASEAIIKTAEQMAIGSRDGIYTKIALHSDCDHALRTLADRLQI